MTLHSIRLHYQLSLTYKQYGNIMDTKSIKCNSVLIYIIPDLYKIWKKSDKAIFEPVILFNLSSVTLD